MIQIAWMAIFPQLSIDFVQIFLQSTTLSKETKGQGIVQENFTPGQGIIFRNLTPGQGSFFRFSSGTSPYARRPSTPPPQEYELKRIWSCSEVAVIAAVIGALGTISKDFH